MKYITFIRKSFQGAWVISGIIGTRQYMFYSKQNAIGIKSQFGGLCRTA